MQFEWLEQANEKALGAGIPLHFKQFGAPGNNPIVQKLIADARGRGTRISPTMALNIAVKYGTELCGLNEKGHPREKGGAPYKGRVIQEKPHHWHHLKAELTGPFDAGQSPILQSRSRARP